MPDGLRADSAPTERAGIATMMTSSMRSGRAAAGAPAAFSTASSDEVFGPRSRAIPKPPTPNSMSKTKTATEILNELIETLKDGQEGFRTAAEDVTSASVKELCGDCSLQRFKYVHELQELAKSLGEPSPADSTSLASKVHRGWINLKSVLTRQDEHAVLAECERGEDAAVAHFTEALQNELPPHVKAAVETQLAGIKAAHD